MSLVDSIYCKLFPESKPKWILYQTHEYSAGQEHYLKAFPPERVLARIKLLPMEGGISDEEAADRAKKSKVRFVLGGMDFGSQRAPFLNQLLGFYDNDPQKSRVRLEKTLSVAASQHYAIPTHPLTDLDQAMAWVSKIRNQEIIIKPDVGVLGQDTQYCKTRAKKSLRELFQKRLASGKKFILQPRIRGRKFFANTYTFEGITKIVSAAEYFQIDNQDKPNYFLNGFLSLYSPEVEAMQKAVDFLIPAHEISFGMGHPEFIQDMETGEWYLMEMNGRVGGAGLPQIDIEVYGISHLHLHLLALLDPIRFRQEFKQFPRGRKKSGFMFVVSTPGAGFWNPVALQTLRTDPSFFLPGPQYELNPKSPFSQTLSMDTAQGIFYFVGNRGVVRTGIERALELYKSGALFDHSDACAKVLRQISKRRARLGKNMDEQFSQIPWRRF